MNMNSVLKKAGLGVALAATALTAAAPADAQRYRGGWGGYGRHYDRHYDRTGPALVAGIAGLAIGAAIASNGRDRYRDDYYRDRGYPRDYDYRYYRQRGYYPNDGYYAQRYYRGGYGGCRVERRWDPYYGQPVRVRVCY
jgi:hypothetical protein